LFLGIPTWILKTCHLRVVIKIVISMFFIFSFIIFTGWARRLLLMIWIQFPSSWILHASYFEFARWRLLCNIMLMLIWFHYFSAIFSSKLIILQLCIIFVHFVKFGFTLVIMLLQLQFLMLRFSICIQYLLLWTILGFWIRLVSIIICILLFWVIFIAQPIFGCLFFGITNRHQTCK